ncbi:hypothetical protein MATL_G00124630 [Megalops atlanticus]|uniref:Ig-like domain-containing protein n=1 Tax=Megalops atlanticus TaxID=7932 RepID=A0A9D3PV79_MEGAT|nr:hypothetical protein MATL_G00124630 [Megalops atlanticus]
MESRGIRLSLCSVIEGLVIWIVGVASDGWVVEMPGEISAVTGSCVVIPCRFTPPQSHQPVHVTWYQYVSRGYPLVYSSTHPDSVISKFRGRTELVGSVEERNCSLRINNVQAEHNAEQLYVWIDDVSHKFYDKTVTLRITAGAPQPQIRVRGNLTALRKGASVGVSCAVIHTCPSSPPSISLRNASGPLQASHTPEGGGRWRAALDVSWNASAEDHGRSVGCDVQHPGGLTASAEMVLNVEYAPKSVRIHGDRVTVPLGSNVSLVCESDANPPVDSFQWHHDVDGQVTSLNLTAQNVTLTALYPDESLVHCTARNPLGNSTSPGLQLTTEYGPSVSADSHCSFLGGAVSCTCEARARPAATLQWKVDGEPRPSGPSQPGPLQKHTVRGTWAANRTAEAVSVTCVASNAHGQDQHRLKVFVKAPPAGVSLVQRPAWALEGEAVTLSCHTDGYPPVLGYRWYSGPAQRETELGEESHELRVANADRSSGPYRCSARNEMGETSSRSRGLNLQYAPVILPNSGCMPVHGRFRCECQVDSNPTPNITWTSLLTNETLNTSSTSNGRILTAVLTGSMGGEGFRVYCNATNRHGAVSRQLPFAGASAGSWKFVLAAGGAVLLCLSVGLFSYWKYNKSRKRSIPDTITLKRVNQQKPVERDSCHIYENHVARNQYESIYTNENTCAPRTQKLVTLKKQASCEEDVYAN